MSRPASRLPFAGLVAAAAVAASTSAAAAAGPPVAPDPQQFTLPAGLACPFELDIQTSGGAQVHNTAGSTLITAGTGTRLVFTNTATGETLTTRSNGAVSRVTTAADGTQTHELLGHNAVILFPSDVPAGPSTVVYSGRVVIEVGTDGVWTLISTSGRSLDVCAELTG